MGRGWPRVPRTHSGEPVSLQGAPKRYPRGGLSLLGTQPHCARALLRRKSLINATSAAKPSTAAPRSTRTSAFTRATSPSSANFAAKAFTKKVTFGARPSIHLTWGLSGSQQSGRKKDPERGNVRAAGSGTAFLWNRVVQSLNRSSPGLVSWLQGETPNLGGGK